MTTPSITFSDAPSAWRDAGAANFSTLHQLSPYIGKLKPVIASQLVESFTRPGELVGDPFCGSGTVPLEALRAGRRVFAADSSAYAFVVTQGKLNAPCSLEVALAHLERTLERSKLRPLPNLSSIPEWVRAFFHPDTLTDCIRFADECMQRRDYFLMSCFLGILHHQRPGFLSFPSSHLVPYLRSKKFPRESFPEMYEYRGLESRMVAKVCRSLKNTLRPENLAAAVIRRAGIERVSFPDQLDAVITSPPYMNALDYRRDNRLRLWFVDRSTANYSPEPTDKRAGLNRVAGALITKSASSLRSGGHFVLVVGEAVNRKRIKSHPSMAFLDLAEADGRLKLVEAIRDEIPDVRRSRREGRATKMEHILVFKKKRVR